MKFNFQAATKWAAAFVLAHWLEVPGVVRALILLMMVDYSSGLAAAFIRSELDSSAGLRGLVKKCMILLLLFAVHVGERALGLQLGVELESVVAVAYCANELVSLVENCARAGVPIPKALVEALMKTKQLRANATPEEVKGLEEV